jgi:ketosteroid isomerase-like protein
MGATAPASKPAHADTIRSVYDAFGRGDIPAILELLADDVEWEQWGSSFAQRSGVPWLQPRAGRDGVLEFFRIVGEFEISEFAVLDVMASDTQAVAEIVIEAAVPGGGRFRDEELHLWRFDESGKISHMRHYVDTAKHIAAARGEDLSG